MPEIHRCGNCACTPEGSLTNPSRYALCSRIDTMVRVRPETKCIFWEVRR